MSLFPYDENTSPIPVLSPTSTEKLAISGTAATSEAATTPVSRLCATVDCFYAVSGTATTSSCFLPANSVEYIKVAVGSTLSVITAGASGSIFISQLS